MIKLSDIPKNFLQDPLYFNVLTAKNRQDYDKHLEILLSIRGSQAIAALKSAIKTNKTN